MFIQAHNATLQTAAANGFLILPGHQQAFLDMESALRGSFKPNPGVESYFFFDILRSCWNLRRCQIAELQLHSTQTDQTIDPLLDDKHEKVYKRLRQFERANRLALHKALRQLGDIQTEIRYRLQTFPPIEGTTSSEQAPHNLSVLCHTGTVLAGALKTGQTAIARTVKLIPAHLRELARMLLSQPGAAAAPNLPPEDPSGATEVQ